MKKSILTGLAMLLMSSYAQSSVSALAVTESNNASNTIMLPITLNNQSEMDISTDSEFVPEYAKTVGSKDAVSFNVEISEVGTKHIRYTINKKGCDFYIDTEGGINRMGFISHITALPLDSFSMCNVVNAGGVNHLSMFVQGSINH